MAGAGVGASVSGSAGWAGAAVVDGFGRNRPLVVVCLILGKLILGLNIFWLYIGRDKRNGEYTMGNFTRHFTQMAMNKNLFLGAGSIGYSLDD